MKQFLRLLARFSQQSGQNCILETLLKNCLEICLEKNPSSIVSRTLRWKFSDFRQSFIRVVKTAFQMSGGKLWELFQKKDVILANSEKWANFFLEFSLKFLQFVKLLHSSRSEKNNFEKVPFFSKKTFFFDHFQHFIKNFRTFHQLFSSGLSNVPFQCPDELCLAN